MFSAAFSALWIMLGYLILLILMGIFTARLGRMRGIKTKPGYLGAVFWVLGVLLYFILAQVGSPDVIILITISIAAPLFYIINLIAILLKKKEPWVDPNYKVKGLTYLLIFVVALIVYVIGLVIA
ncbi:MAG: hypothetical protein ACNA70_08785 [Brevefilum sp.]